MRCQGCGENKIYLEIHHLFSKSKVNKKLYGDLIHDKRNLILLCPGCHHNKPLKKFTEMEFCQALGIKPRSKTERMRDGRD